MHLSKIIIENFRCFGEGEQRFVSEFKAGLTALVGENDAGKTAVIDAIRYALGTSDQEWLRLEDDDFHVGSESREIRISCKFSGLSARDRRAFLEYLTYGLNPGDEPVLWVNWTAKDSGETRHGRPYRRTEMCSGKDGDGPPFDQYARALLHATYLRPLRDAGQALSAGRGSRLAQVLQHSELVKQGQPYDPAVPVKAESHDFSIAAVAQLLNELLKQQKGIKQAGEQIDAQLKGLSLHGDNIKSAIEVSGADTPEEIMLRQMLEKLDLSVSGNGRAGLGSDNLLFMACELILLAQEDGSRLLLIEEPEAHLHAQRQLRAMRFLQEQATQQGVQVIVTTHSPNLASAIDLNNIVMIHDRRAFPMAEGMTELEKSDYRFLERFLDVTKANLFFARGVVIVEGDAEQILLPTLARLLGRDFTEHGVSIVNVGGVGLRRYARIFRRKQGTEGQEGAALKTLNIPVACMADMDVMPNCAPTILGKKQHDDGTWPKKRRWKMKHDFGEEALKQKRADIESKASGQNVKTFVSDEWTLEYDLALGPRDKDGKHTGGLAEHVYVAACLALADDKINNGTATVTVQDEETKALAEFEELSGKIEATEDSTKQEVLASHVYRLLAHQTKTTASKPIAAQYLVERLQKQHKEGKLTTENLRKQLPAYVVQAIEYVTGGPQTKEKKAEPEGQADG